MAFVNTNDFITGRKPVTTCDGYATAGIRFELNLVAADLDANDIGQIGVLPAGCVPVALLLDSDDLDTGGTPTIVASVGLLNDAGTDLSSVWVAGSTICQTGGQVQLLSKELARVAPDSNKSRAIGLKFTAGAATKAAGTVGLTLLYRAA